MFASRSQRHIDAYVRVHGLQQTIRSLYEQLPANLQSAAGDEVRSALGCATTMHIVRLAYGGQDWHMAAKDINFQAARSSGAGSRATAMDCAVFAKKAGWRN